MIEKYRTAILQRDLATLGKIWADDYVFVNAAGDVVAKTERLARVKSARPRWTRLTGRKMSRAVTTSCVTLKGHYSGQPISGEYRSTLVWVKGSGGWQLVSNQLTALKPK
jgi:ketosteroid isomerase-like protein